MIIEYPRRYIVYSCTLCDFNSLNAKEATDHNCPSNPDDMSRNRFGPYEALDEIATMSKDRVSVLRLVLALRAYITGIERRERP